MGSGTHSEELALLKRQWELGIINGEEYFIEKTRLASTTASVVGVMGAGAVVSKSTISNGVKLAGLSVVGSVVIGISALGWYAVQTEHSSAVGAAAEISRSANVEAISLDDRKRKGPSLIPLGHVVTPTTISPDHGENAQIESRCDQGGTSGAPQTGSTAAFRTNTDRVLHPQAC